MQITSFSDYSLRILIYLGIRGEKASITEISKAFGISKNHLVKAAHNLIKLGYIRSIRGKHGGILLAVTPSSINLGEIIQQLEPNLDIVECFDKKTNTCNIAPTCHLKSIFREAEQAFLKTLNKYSLAELIKNKKQLIQYISV